jgi:hypothetical protein
LFSKRDQLHAESPKAPHHCQRQHCAENVADPRSHRAFAGHEHRAKKKNQRHHEAEKEKRPIPHRQPDARSG